MPQPDEYTVGWICAINVEYVAAQELLDEEYEGPDQVGQNDNNNYALGRIGKHNVVIATLPFGEYGITSAATVARDMVHTFPNVRIGLMVGIGGGAPSPKHDIRLGDIVVSAPGNGNGGLLQYDFGKIIQGQSFRPTGVLNQPPVALRAALAGLKAHYERKGHGLEDIVKAVLEKNKRLRRQYQRPAPGSDSLYEAETRHLDAEKCCADVCGPSGLVWRPERAEDQDNPAIHYGLIASGSQLMKSALDRDRLASEKDILCFEMEAAGLINHFPCVVIRGIYDYSDSHNNKEWKGYAAMVAAAYAKDLLKQIAPSKVETEKKLCEVLLTKLSNIEKGVGHIKEDVKHVISSTQSKEETDILEWLSPKGIDFSSMQNNSRDAHMSGTGQWLLDDHRYQQWRDRTPGLLWLYGAVGCGKTILCSTIIHDLQDRVTIDPSKHLAYWYFRFNNNNFQNISKMLRAIIRQLTPLPLPMEIQSLRSRHWQKGTEPSLEELTPVLTSIINTLIGDTYIVFDALDECLRADQNGQRNQLFNILDNLITERHAKLHLLVTSRPEPDIRQAFNEMDKVSFDIEKLIKGDVEMYVEARLTESDLASWDDDSKDKIRTKLLLSHERRFRWADLQIQRFARCPTLKDLEYAINSIPETLEAIYQEAFEGINKRNQDYVLNIMMWLVASFEPLNASQLAAIVGFRESRFVLEICTTLLVTIIEEDTTDIIKLAHFSVKEFLVVKLTKKASIKWFQFSTKLAHNHIAYIAVKALLKPDGPLKPIFDYAARSWPRHTTEGLEINDCAKLEEQIEVFFDANHTEQFQHWLSRYDPDNPFGRPGRDYVPAGRADHLYYACLLGFDRAVSTLLAEGIELSAGQRVHSNALNAAAVRGNARIVRRMMKECKNVVGFLDIAHILESMEGKVEAIGEVLDSIIGSEISVDMATAAARNYLNGKDVMALLLDKRGDQVVITEDVVKAAAGNWRDGNDIMALLLDKRGDQVVITEDIVKAAAGNWRDGKDIIALLLNKRGDQVVITEDIVKATAENWRDGKDIIALLLNKRENQVVITADVVSQIASAFDSDIIELLLDKRGDQVVITEDVVKAAARNWSNGNDIMALLLDKRGDQVVITEDIVKAAAFSGGKDTMALLLDKRGDQVVITEDVVKAAAVNENDGNDIMALLLDKRGDQVVITEDIVKAAAGNWRDGKDIMVLLLDNREDQVVITENVVKAVAANENDGNDIMALLLDKRGDQVVITEDIVKAAAGNWSDGKDIMALLLLTKRAQTLALNSDRFTLLNPFAASGYLEGIKLLLDERADLAAADNDGWTPLNSASAGGNLEVAKLLLERGANLTVANEKGWTPLNSASAGGHLEVVKLLLEKGADLAAANNDGWTPLHNASYGGHLEVANLCLDNGADPKIPNHAGLLPIHSACFQGHLGLVKLLLKTSTVNINVKDGKHGLTPLCIAAKRGHYSVVQLLLARSETDVTLTDDIHQQPALSWAAENGYHSICTILLQSGKFDVHHTDPSGLTALQRAAIHGHDKVMKVFLPYDRSCVDLDIYGLVSLLSTKAISISTNADIEGSIITKVKHC